MTTVESTSDAFLQGQGIPVRLREIEATIQQLWGPAAERVGGPEPEHPHVTRIVLANLVVERLIPECEALRPVVESVITLYPCRAIIIRSWDDSGRQIGAEVSAVCHLPAPGLPQVCSERIVLRAGPNAVDLIAGSVRPLLEADLPMVLWWTTDPLQYEALFRDLGAECSRLVLDPPDPGTSPAALRLGLDPTLCSCSRDTSWYGITRWRELVAQFFDPPCHQETLGRIDSLQIEASSPDPSRPPRTAIWMTAWLAGQLGWKPQEQPQRVSNAEGSTLRATFRGPLGPISAEIVTSPVAESMPCEPRLLGVTLTARGAEGAECFSLSRPTPGSEDILIQAKAPKYCRLPTMIHAPEPDAARRVATALEAPRVDRPLESARPIAFWLMEDF